MGAKVTIGLPVYNGQRYLPLAIDSILSQTYGDFELLIVDNASTDGTRAICEAYAAKDSRIRYYGNAENIGAARNFNLAFQLAQGQYFKWAAHDDILAPTFLAETVKVLDADPEVVLCHSYAGVIDESGQLREADIVEVEADLPSPFRRFRAAVFGPRCYEVFGLIRSNALERTDLIGLHARGDGVLLARLALLGRYRLVPHCLFFARRHREQSMVMVDNYHAYARWFDPIGQGGLVFPDWRLCGEYFRALRGAGLTAAEYASCAGTVLRWASMNRRRLVRDLRVATEVLCFGASNPTERRILRLPWRRKPAMAAPAAPAAVAPPARRP